MDNNNKILITAKYIFQQIIDNINKKNNENTEDKSLDKENIYAKDLCYYDFIELDNDDDTFSDIIQLISILNKEID